MISFGLSNAPGMFTQLISIVLSGMAYLDDVLVFFRTQEDHFRHLQIVFDWLREHGLRLKLLKCQFL